jgi:outer membrane protein OmpA-like peptidoglycan-associated protein
MSARAELPPGLPAGLSVPGLSGGPTGGFTASLAVFLFIALITLTGTHSCAPVQVSRTLQKEVEAALTAAGQGSINVVMRGQTAVLSGVVASVADKAAAQKLALEAAGPGGAWLGGVARVENQIIVGAVPSPYTWSATREQSGVRLRGYAPSRVARAAIAEKAKTLFGTVADETSVAPGAPAGGEWQTTMIGALEQLARLETAAVRASGLKLTIIGEAEAEAARAVQAFYQNGAPGGFSALVDLSAPGQVIDVPAVSGLKLSSNAAAADCQQAFASLLARNVINFDTGSAMISPTSRSLLDDLGRVARRCDQYSIEIAGHTDDRGDRASNMKLSLARGEAVVRYMVDQGVAPERLEAAGFGPDRPRAPNRTPAGQAQNRRIVFRVKS